MKIIILTGSELRHDFIRKAIALNSNIKVLKSYCEGTEKSLIKLVDSKLKKEHLESRAQSEKDFFSSFLSLTPDHSNQILIPRGSINKEEYINEIKNLNPDIILAYGCSIIKEPLIEYFSKRIVNIHLGLSPYYRGSGTNFWPLVNKEPEFVGATFMYMDKGIDTGEIIHQIRARIYKGDTPHQIGNRLISDVAIISIELIKNFWKLKKMNYDFSKINGKYYTNKDFTENSVKQLYNNINNGLIDDYLTMAESEKAPIIKNPAIRVSLQ